MRRVNTQKKSFIIHRFRGEEWHRVRNDRKYLWRVSKCAKLFRFLLLLLFPPLFIIISVIETGEASRNNWLSLSGFKTLCLRASPAEERTNTKKVLQFGNWKSKQKLVLETWLDLNAGRKFTNEDEALKSNKNANFLTLLFGVFCGNRFTHGSSM